MVITGALIIKAPCIGVPIIVCGLFLGRYGYKRFIADNQSELSKLSRKMDTLADKMIKVDPEVQNSIIALEIDNDDALFLCVVINLIKPL